MSDDLVKRLKETIEFGLFDTPNPVTFDECLAEIEYLRADLASACSQLREAALDEIAALRAENARLRDALEDIAIFGCGMLNQPSAMNAPEEVWLRKRIREYERRAYAALGGENG